MNIVNEKGTTIYNNSISGAKNKIKVSNENLKITVSKDGYVPQTFNFTKDSLANYETTALQVKLEYNSFYIEALTTEDGSTWNYTNANLNIVNGEGTSIYNKTISGAKNKITVSNENLYKITISKDGYVSQTFNFTKDSLANYETTALKVKLQEVTYDFYIEALTSEDNTTWNYTNANLNIVNGEGTSIYSNAINGEKNKITVSNENLYKITISKDGYFPQTFNFTKDSLANYETTALQVKLEKVITITDSSLTNSIGMEFVLVEAGTFMMGDSNTLSNGAQPVHEVTLTKDYYIGKYEVTQAQWVAVMGSNPSWFKGDNLPVEMVTWYDVKEFITKLNQMEGGDKYSLPTEAQWEFAARGGNKSQGYTYAGSNNLDEVAWYSSNSSSQTHQVGTKKANELGIYDMSGNVWEWCSDCYETYSSAAVSDPMGASSSSDLVRRGGSWFSYDYCRVAFRFGYNTGYFSGDVGFRLSCSLK